MGEVATVKKIDGDVLTASLVRSDACADCHACKIGANETEMIIEAKNLCGAKVGDKVMIELEASDMIKATVIMYGIPLVVMMFGFWAGNFYSQLAGFLLGIVLLGITYFVIRSFESYFKTKNFISSATRIVEE